MKLFSIFMLVFTLGGFASGYSQKQVVTLNLKQCDVNTLLQEIWKQTGLRFVYNEQDVARLKRFDVNAQQKQVDEILDHIFKNTPYQCAYESDVIYITPRPVGDLPQVKQERVKLSGNIKDKNGNVLPGVTVFIGNSDIGTSSDINGNYQLAILKGNAVEIVYSFIGMKKVTYNFPATEDVRHNVVMEEDQVELQDVVVIGYGSKSARNLTSSVSSVKAKDLEKYANGATTFDNMPGGAVKGVLVNQNSGEPGAKATLNIRGITSPDGERGTRTALTEFTPEGGGTPRVLTEIRRNNVYRIIGTVKEKTVQFEQAVLPWTEAGQGTIIDPQYYLRVSRDVLHVGLAGDAVTISVETNYNRGDRGFPKGVRLGEISYYDKDNHPLEATAGGRDWLAVNMSGVDGDLSRNIEFIAKTSLNSVPAGYYALVEIKAGNLIKIIRVTRS